MLATLPGRNRVTKLLITVNNEGDILGIGPMIPNVARQTVTIVVLTALVTTPAAAVVVTDEPVQRQRVHPEAGGTHGVMQSDERCGTLENATISEQTFSVDIANGTVENLELDGSEVTATIDNGSVLFDQAAIFVGEATLEDEQIGVTSETVTVRSGTFFLRNATATVDGEEMSLSDRELGVETNAASDEGITISGIGSLPGAPATVLVNSSAETVTIDDLSDDLRFDSATREVLGVVTLSMDDVELSESPLSPTFSDVTIDDSELTADSISVPVEDGDISIEELAVSSEGVTTRSNDVDADIEDETATFDDVTFPEGELTALLEDAC